MSVVWEKKKKSDSLQVYSVDRLHNEIDQEISLEPLAWVRATNVQGTRKRYWKLTYLRHYRTGLLKVVVSQFLIKALLMPVTLLFEA